MVFDEQNKVLIDTLNPTEAKAFIKFLKSEVYRHQRDIEDAKALIEKVRELFE